MLRDERSDLVTFRTVLDCHIEAELPFQAQHRHDIIGAMCVDAQWDLFIQHFDDGFEL